MNIVSFSYQKCNVEIEWKIKFSFFVLIFMWDSSENYIYCHRKTPNNFRHDKKKKKKKNKLSQRVMGIQVIWLQNNSIA
jgi:hypothetical protein